MSEKLDLTARDKDLLLESLSHLMHLHSCVTKLEYSGNYNSNTEEMIENRIRDIRYALLLKLIKEE